MTERPENDFDRKWPWPEMTAFSIQYILPFLPKKKKFVQVTGALLRIGLFFRTFAPAIERKLLLYQMSVLIDDKPWS